LAISVELVDVRNNKTLWGQQYNRKLADMLVTQQEIASEIVQNLKLKISGDDQKGLTKRYTGNNEAYQLYLKGRFFYGKGDVERGVEYFNQAIQLDPNFAQAFVGLSDSYSSMPSRPILSPNEALPKAKAAAQRALEIDPALAEAHAALATSVTLYDWNWAEGERQYKRALELNPNVADIHYRYGMYHFLPMGRTGEAIAEFTRALELEPLSLNIGANLAGVYLYARQNERALEQAQKADNLEPDHPLVRAWLGYVYIINGMFTEAIALSEKSLQTDPSNQLWLGIAACARAKTGRRREAEDTLQKLQGIARTRYVIPFIPAVIYAALGERDQAFAQLEKAFVARDIYLLYLKVDPALDPLRGDARFRAMVKRMELPQ
jgi:tetratricopeptide (TPR) repeat protein